MKILWSRVSHAKLNLNSLQSIFWLADVGVTALYVADISAH